jgi:hypothetical protein
MPRAANVTSGDVVDWHSIDWKHVYRTVKNLRQRKPKPPCATSRRASISWD